MIRNDQIQAALVTKLKATSIVTSQLTTADEIREDQWSGTTFVYPNIRVNLISNRPFDPCRQQFDVSFMSFSESDNSEEADKIAGIIATALDDISYIADGMLISLAVTDVLPAFRSDVRTWRAEAKFQGLISAAT